MVMLLGKFQDLKHDVMTKFTLTRHPGEPRFVTLTCITLPHRTSCIGASRRRSLCC